MIRSRKRRLPRAAVLPLDDSVEENAGSKLCSNTDKYLETLKETLLKEYRNVAQRLRIKDLPKCLLNPAHCAQAHFRNKEIDLVDDGVCLAKTLVETHHPLTVLRVIDLYTEGDQFAGLPMLKLILELILSINVSPHNEYKIPDVLEIAVLTFKKVLETFPPCWSAALADYRQLILGPIGANGLLQGDDFDPNENLLSHLLRFVERLIQPVSMVTTHKEELNDSELMKDFCLWIDTSEQKYQFSEHSRDVKIERVFVVFELLMDVLEYDLALWTLKNLHCPDGRMHKPHKTPLIALFLWPDNQVKEVNFTIKNIIRLYFELISIDFDESKICSLRRLINLMSNVFELSCDHTTSEGGIIYPFIWPNDHKFGVAFHKTLKEHSAYSSTFVFKVIKQSNLPAIQKLLIERFVYDLDGKKVDCSVKSVRRLLVKLKRPSDSDEENENNNIIKAPGQQKYPCVSDTKRRYTSAVTDKEYFELFLKLLQAYASLKHLKEFHMSLLGRGNDESETKEVAVAKRGRGRPSKLESRRRRSQRKSAEAQQVSAKGDLIPDVECLNLGDVEIVTAETAKQYLEDIKYAYHMLSKREDLSISRGEMELIFGSCDNSN